MKPKFSDIAKKLVYGVRNKSYGSPKSDYTRTSAVWTGLLIHKLKPGHTINAEEAVIMMTALKLCRQMARHKDDNLIDAHGYLECAEWIISENLLANKTTKRKSKCSPRR
jgi:hypothetical protein